MFVGMNKKFGICGFDFLWVWKLWVKLSQIFLFHTSDSYRTQKMVLKKAEFVRKILKKTEMKKEKSYILQNFSWICYTQA